MKENVRVIVKKPNLAPEEMTINSYKEINEIIGCKYTDKTKILGTEIYCIVDDVGCEKEYNFTLPQQDIHGTAVFIGFDGVEDYDSLTDEECDIVNGFLSNDPKITKESAKLLGVEFKVSEEEMKKILNKIKFEDNSVRWNWTKDGWGYPMLTTNRKGITYDVCVNCNDKNLAIIYKIDGMFCETYNMTCNFVNRFVKGKIMSVPTQKMMLR